MCKICLLLFLAVIGCIVGNLIFETDKTLFYLSCAAITGLCGYHAITSLYAGRINIGALVSSQTMLWYALPFSYIGFFDFAQYVRHATETSTADAVALVVVVAFACFVVFERFGPVMRFGNLPVDWRSYAPLLLFVVACQFAVMASGGLYYSAGSQDAESNLLAMFAKSIAPAVLPMCALAMATLIRTGKRDLLGWAFCLGVVAAELLWFSVAGRRPLTLVIVISVICFLASYSVRRISLGRLFTFGCVGLIGATCLWYAWDAYYTLRLATNAAGGWQEFSIFDLAEARQEAVRLGGQSAFLSNVVSRPFGSAVSVAVFLETATGVMWGWNAVSQVLLAIPSAIFPDKIHTIGPTLENLWSAQLGVPANDWGNTLFIEGYSDFGPFGFPIYVIGLVLMSKIFLTMARRSRSPSIQVFLFFTITFLALNIEATVAAYLSTFRSMLAIMIATAALRLFFGPQRRARTTSALAAFDMRQRLRRSPGAAARNNRAAAASGFSGHSR